MAQTAKKLMIKIPLSIFESAETKEELEDWLLANNPEFIDEMNKIKQNESGKGISLSKAAKKWDIES
ncbi:MAG: hypothetical protein A3I05_07855 [Deltaproteobacteria bacterium RIFCSPLOWO2_02_FULL_44_10]|nr:MAG: hypothetical protein A3I05_07855 [Deltaproteobacteria bacterium RIFCSPLOWO2_02_FULL_44_10]